MAFQAAAGYGNLPNGVFSPVIYSKKVQKTFRKKSVIEAITNNDYFGEIKNFGDSVKIIVEPEITIVDYARGAKITPQDLEDSDFTLIIDRAKAFAFKIDDIEEAHSHVNWESLATNRAAYRLADAMDADILGYLAGYEKNGSGTWVARTAAVGTNARSAAGTDELLSIHKLARDAFVTGGSASDSIAMGTKGTKDATPLEILNRMQRLLDEQNVDTDGRWVVVDPVFLEHLRDEDSKFVSNDYAGNQDAGDLLRNGKVTTGKIRGFDIHVSNNLPTFGTGPATLDTNGSNANYGVIVAGQTGAVATAQQLSKTETLRAPDTFGDIFRGMHLYGRKILRPESLVRAIWNSSK